MELTVLMPCLNEAATVGACVEDARRFLAQSGLQGEVLVADNGSSDGSADIARRAGARVVDVPQRGYGAALMAGIQAAHGRFIVMGDADQSYDFSRLDGFIARLREGAQVVMGNRFMGGIEPGAMPPLHRYLGNPVLSWIGRLFFRTKIGDFHCGLRGFSRQAVLDLGLVTPGMEFASEMVAKAAMAGLRIEEVPTSLRPDGRGRPSHLRTWRDGWRHLRFLMLFCPRWLFLYPGMALLSAGMAGLLLGLPAVSRSIGSPFGIHTMLYMAAATIIGVQLVVFALLAKWMAVQAGLVPQPPWLHRAGTTWTLERGLLAGAALFIVGLGWSVALTVDWGRTGFGPLDPVEVMRSAIPAVALMAVGMQASMAALFAGALHSAWKSGLAK